MEDQKLGPGVACNLDFVTGKRLEPKVKKFSKIVQVERRSEQTFLAQTYHRLGSGSRPLAIFCNFFGKK